MYGCHNITNKSISGSYGLPKSKVFSLDINSNGLYSFQFISYGYEGNDTIRNNGTFVKKEKYIYLNSIQKNTIDNTLTIKEKYDYNLKDSIRVTVFDNIEGTDFTIPPFSNISSIEMDYGKFVALEKNPFTWKKRNNISFMVFWYLHTVESKYYLKNKNSNVFEIYQNYKMGFNIWNKKKKFEIFDNEPVLIEKDKLIIFKDVELKKITGA